MDFSGKTINETCPCCQKKDWKFLYNSTFKNYNIPIYLCLNCGLQTQYPKPEPSKLYTEEYYSGKANFSYRDERQTEKFDRYVWKARISNIQKFKSNGEFLDVGCSFGGFLNCAKEAGFQVTGVEISHYSAEVARSRGLKIYTGEFLDIDLPENFFDVITLVEVIEHLSYPEKVFEKLGKILKPGGLLLIQTANFEGWQAINAGADYHYYLPGHFYYYSESNLKKILDRFGFRDSITYLGVDFSIFAKLLKSRGSFKSWNEYWKWIRISVYHWKSKLKKQNRPLTSSMVLYGFKAD
ncbi:methionine biosynthesis protein MetW-like protein [Leptospira interrogans str. 2003000735]|uniref:Methionine biosynthesis protein MetW-like protein n=4 Tax=Leptospira interrogans TaxID=173 RepID=A0A829DC00_LEPIR|nr:MULTISPECIES: class I SAM-dependent methyltransferase [Leptospira]EMF41216.1 methionine biosynthesis protein MetW-like protein [Leptospira interrogans serovar Lora str. TE 1992]EMM96556.1 methionine biosynthesis protein MetW-like protein [Leptospira interrogans serovar Zanoni str. LT2156]EMY06565.1 methionine biosynthesis protein MetW-like protein [Leptospira interrogans str. 2002000626]EMY27252.1 methionine biosynthesis protein MetW-like protein [Leptospira interrogans serovar Australis str